MIAAGPVHPLHNRYEKEEGMATPLGPGNYFIRLKDDVPSLFTEQGSPVDATVSPTFETVGDAVFNFTTEGMDPQGQPLVFEAPIITWRDPKNNNPVGTPPHNASQPNGTTVLVLTVDSPSAAQTVQFTLHLNGTTIDPTIVEKPPETSPLPDDQG
jgi:hypothetical protein